MIVAYSADEELEKKLNEIRQNFSSREKNKFFCRPEATLLSYEIRRYGGNTCFDGPTKKISYDNTQNALRAYNGMQIRLMEDFIKRRRKIGDASDEQLICALWMQENSQEFRNYWAKTHNELK